MMHLKPKFLVISTVNDLSLHRYWCPSPAYDTCLIYYGNGPGFPNAATYYKQAKGPKFHLIDQILTEHPEWLSEYHYFWLPDDDVCLPAEEVLRLFQLTMEYHLDISQPGMIGWYGPTPPLCNAGTILRYTNWVEIMCPVLSRHAVRKCRETFTANITGWSIDAAWNVLLGHPTNKIAIIDDVVAIHTRPVFGGDVYKQLDGDNPLVKGWNDAFPVRLKYHLNEETAKDQGKPLGQGEIFNCVTYGEVKKEMEGEKPRSERFWPLSPILLRAIQRELASPEPLPQSEHSG
jgi:hypothetical protein